jgi:Flp pilus assembly protein TadB
MNEQHKPRFLPRRGSWAYWPRLVLIAALGVGLAVAGVFFFVFALIAGAIVTTAVGIRLWWLMRKLRAQAKNTEALEGQYTVIPRTRAEERLER